MKERVGSSLHAVNLLFGELQNIDRDIFADGLSTLLKDVPRDADIVHIQIEPARLSCNVCEREWGLNEVGNLTPDEREAIHFLPEAAHAFFRCPSCGSQDCRITQGRGISVASIELNEPNSAGAPS
jgi:hydrogenase nickel incorporation protein HypA/HybF